MGWTETQAYCRKSNGTADIKADLDRLFESTTSVFCKRIIKSQIAKAQYGHSSQSKVYYGALECQEQPYHVMQRNDGGDGRTVTCVVVLIEPASDPRFDYMYKEMDEFCAPSEAACPASILNLLTPTDSEWANEWRAECRSNAESKAFASKLSKLPLGSEIVWTVPDGIELTLNGNTIEPGSEFHLFRERHGRGKKWIAYTAFGMFYVEPKRLNCESVRILTQPTAA